MISYSHLHDGDSILRVGEGKLSLKESAVGLEDVKRCVALRQCQHFQDID
jgi:hypothetical protein